MDVYNNIFYATTDKPMISISAGNDVNFVNNAYYNTTGVYRYNYEGTTYSSLVDWQMGRGQERFFGSNVGFQGVDPQLAAPGKGAAIDDAYRLNTLDQYRLLNGSPLIDAGLDLGARFTIPIGNQDYFGAAPLSGKSQDMGAGETGAGR